MFDHILVYDTETASLAVEDGIVEHAWIEIDDNMDEIERVQSLIKPEGPISFSAMGVHGITEAMVADAPTMDDHLAGRFWTKSILMVAHNAQFDAKYLRPHCGMLDTICTLKLARIAYPDAPDHKLTTLLRMLDLPVIGAHNALDDVSTTRGLLLACAHTLNLDLEGLYELCKKPQRVEKIGFGKHKGTKVVNLPKDYVKWLLKQDNVDANLRWTLENPL